MIEAFHKTCNIKHEIDIKRYGNVKSETDSCQSFRFGFFLLYSSFIFHSLMVRWVLSKLIPTFTSRLPSE